MDGEIVIEGFSKESIIECSTKFLKSKENSEEMLRQAKETGIDLLLHIPIILVMTVVIFIEGKKLPASKTELYKTIFKLVIDRTTWKTVGLESNNISTIDEMLDTLGELSWKALQNDVHQLVLKKVRKFYQTQRKK